MRVNGPNGIVVNFPDGTDAQTIDRVMREAMARSQPEPQVSNEAAKQDPLQPPVEFADTAKALGAGLGRGAFQTAGFGGDVRKILSGLGGMASPEIGQAISQGMSVFPGFGAAGSDVLAETNRRTRPAPNISQLVTGEQPKAPLEYEGRNDVSKFAGKVGEFATGALGPGGPVRRAANVILPAVGSEAGRIASGGNPYAEMGGALLGGLGAAAKYGRTQSGKIAKGAPSAVQVKSASDQMYQTLRDAGVKYDSNAYIQFADRLAKRLKEGGFRDTRAVHSADLIKNEIKPYLGKSPDYSDIEAIRQSAGDILREPSYTLTDKAAAKIIKSEIDKFQMRSAFSHNGTLPGNEVQPLMKQAREMARRNIIARDVQEMMEKAQQYKSGEANGLELQFQGYLKKTHKRRNLTPEELKAFNEVAHGTWGRKAAQALGKFGIDFSKFGNNRTLVPSLGFGGASAMFGMPAGTALTTAGTIAKPFARHMTRNAAARAKSVALSGIDAQKAGAAFNMAGKRQANIRRALPLPSVVGPSPFVPPLNQGPAPFYAPINEKRRDR